MEYVANSLPLQPLQEEQNQTHLPPNFHTIPLFPLSLNGTITYLLTVVSGLRFYPTYEFI